MRHRRPPERHVLVVRAIRRGAPRQKHRFRIVLLRDQVRVVVGDLVVVPREDPRRIRVRRLQIRIRAVLRVAVAIVLQRLQLGREMQSRPVFHGRVLVEVVAEKEHQVEIFFRHLAVRVEIAHFVVCARRKCEPEFARRGTRFGKRARAADRAEMIAGPELIPIPTLGLEAVHFDMHRVRPVGGRRDDAFLHDARHLVVERELPRDVNRRGRHAAAVRRIEREPRPEHDAVGPRIARRDAERKKGLRCR